MGFKVNGTIVIDDNRNIGNLGWAGAASFAGNGTNITGLNASGMGGTLANNYLQDIYHAGNGTNIYTNAQGWVVSDSNCNC